MIERIPHIFIRDFPFGNKIKFFRKVLYAFLFLNTLTLLPIANELFGYHGVIGSSGWNTASPWYKQGSTALLNVLSHPANGTRPWLMYVFLIGHLVSLVTGFLSIMPRLSSIAVYFFTANLFYKGYAAFTGGEVLVVIMLFYLMFIKDDLKKDKKEFVLQNTLNNTFYWVMLIQVCFVYVFSTWYKLLDVNWTDGMALSYIAQIDYFSSGGMRSVFSENTFLSSVAVYITLVYQALFSIVVWVKKVKIPFLFVGVFLHLGIAFGMGLFAFGFIMIMMYLLFLDEEQIIRMIGFLRKRLNLETGNFN